MDYTNYEIVEANISNLTEAKSDVYVVNSEFAIEAGQVTYQDGKKNEEDYIVEKGWVIFTGPETEIIDDFENRFENEPETIEAIKAVL